jgi:hypothetical protein
LQFIIEIQHSWCASRAAKGAWLTLASISPSTRSQILHEWTAQGGGTSSFVAQEAVEFLTFIAERLTQPSPEFSICQFEQATIRADDGAGLFVSPDPSGLSSPDAIVINGRYASLITLTPCALSKLEMLSTDHHSSATQSVTLLFAPGLQRRCRPATDEEIALWHQVRTPVRVSKLAVQGDKLLELLTCGAIEFC